MKRIALFLFLCSITLPLMAQDISSKTILPLLQAQTRSTAQTYQVLQLFLTSKDPNTIFSTGASLVRIPPASTQQVKLVNALLRENNSLRKIFAAIILVAMGNVYEETIPLLEEGISSPDHALRAYAASAYTILNATHKEYAPYIVNLYIYDTAFAQRAINLLANTEKETFHFIKAASMDPDGQIRSAAAQWLGDLQTPIAAKQLLKMAKREANPDTMTAIAVGLSKNRLWVLEDVSKGLHVSPQSTSAATYALALGFMTGYAVDTIKQGLLNSNDNTRINAARAAAYMAGILANPDANSYTQDKEFDIELLKGLIPLLSTLARQGITSVKSYAEHALQQIRKLK